MILLLLLALLQPCWAALINFENCLPEAYRFSDPPALQFVGMVVDASLQVVDSSQNLKVTMWGNVTGSRTRAALPAWDNTVYWKDDSKTEGKILRIPNSEKNIITTLHSKINVLTYEPWNHDADFCAGLTNASCPLGPVFSLNATRYDLPSVTMMNKFTTSYAFPSWAATFLIKYTDSDMLNIGCVSATITPDLGLYSSILRFLPAAILAFVGFATVLAAMFSPWGTSDVIRWTSNYGRDNDLLRLVTPGFGDCLQYIQFVVLTGGLTLNYPGFYQPIISQMSWSTLMFNETLVSKEPGYQSVQDGIYVTKGSYGLQTLAQLTGMGNTIDIWPGMMVWLLVIIASVLTIGEVGFAIRWIYRKVNSIAEEDLRSKNIPFSVGNVVRIVFNYFLLPIVALSTFQMVIADNSPAYTVVLAVVTLVLIIGFGAWVSYLIITIKPRAFLFDDLSTLLMYGPLYNTYSDEAATYTLVQLFLTLLRGIAVGAVQPSGIAQIVILAICEVTQILTIHAILPFHKPTSMNVYHTAFTVCRLVSVLLMVAFVPALGVTEGPRGWIGYSILIVHACVTGFGFFLNALQTTLEVLVRLSGAGSDNVKGLTRGGLSKIFGMRQLQRREGPSRNSQLSNSAMLDQDETNRTGYITHGGRLRSESAGSGALLTHQHRSSSALDNNNWDPAYIPARNLDNASSFTPTTLGEASTFSFLPSSAAGQVRHPTAPLAGGAGSGAGVTNVEPVGPFYRPPRRRGTTPDQAMIAPRERTRGSWASGGDWNQRRFSQAGNAPLADAPDIEGQISRGATPGPYSQPTISFAPRTDYSTREVDFYYGVRGQRLNSDAPSRKLGTGPADPTGPMASAAGWFRNILGGKTKEKGKGFEVVRSSRMPAAMKARGGDITDDAAPQGIPVAMSMLRSGPIDSDDEDDTRRKKVNRPPTHAKVGSGETGLLDEDGNPKDENIDDVAIPKVPDDPPRLPGIEPAGSIHMPSRIQSRASRAGKAPAPLDFSLLNEKDDDLPPPAIPRKSSRRNSSGMSTHSRDSSIGASVHLGAQIPPHDSGNHQQPQLQHPLQQQHQPYLASSAESSRLPFERNDSHRTQQSSGSSLTGADRDGDGDGGGDHFSRVDLRGGESSSRRPNHEDRPTSYGYVQKRNISRIDPEDPRHIYQLEHSAEVVDEWR